MFGHSAIIQNMTPTMDNDFFLVKDLRDLFDEADVLIAHNGDRFDIRKAQARMIRYNMKPPSRYQTIDTLKAARKHFQFDSSRLDALGQYLGLGRKLPTTGFNLWKRTMAGDRKAWAIMKRYNKHDVEILRESLRRTKTMDDDAPQSRDLP